jgi:hypothetical protein
MTSKNSWHNKNKWHAMTNISAINSKHTKTYGVKKKMDNHKIYDTLLPNGMPCHHHMEDQIVINCKGQQYFQSINKRD